MDTRPGGSEWQQAVAGLVASGVLIDGTAADGIARTALQVGYAGLTLKQRAMFDMYLGPLLAKRLAERAQVIRSLASSA